MRIRDQFSEGYLEGVNFCHTRSNKPLIDVNTISWRTYAKLLECPVCYEGPFFVTQFFVGSAIGQKIKGQKIKSSTVNFAARTPNGHDDVVYVECDLSEFPLGLQTERLSANGIGITQ